MPTDVQVTQVGAEQWAAEEALARVTQVAVEHWSSTTDLLTQSLVTQVAVEHWTSVAEAPSGPVVSLPKVVSRPRPKVTAFEIPTEPGRRQKQFISLAGVVYTLSLYWDVPASLWMLDIATEDEVPMVSGLPLVTGVDLLEQHQHLNIGGALVVQSDFDWRVPPTFDNLGVLGHLFFIPTIAAPAVELGIPETPQLRTRTGIGITLPQPEPFHG